MELLITSFSVWHLASVDCTETTASEKHFSLGIWCTLYYRFDGMSYWARHGTICRSWPRLLHSATRLVAVGRVSGMRDMAFPWWRHEMEAFSALLAICAGNSPVPGEFPAQRPVTRSFDVFLDLHPNKLLSKQWWGWWFDTPSCPLWRHRNAFVIGLYSYRSGRVSFTVDSRLAAVHFGFMWPMGIETIDNPFAQS